MKINCDIIYYPEVNFFRVYIKKYPWQIIREARFFKDFNNVNDALSLALKLENYYPDE